MSKETNDNTNNGSVAQSFAYIECFLYCFYPILSIILLTIASVFKRSLDYYGEYTQENLNVVPALLISAGSFAIIILFFRVKMQKGNHMYLMCLVVFPVLLLFQTIALVYGCVQAADNRSYLKKSFQRDMGNIFTKSYYNNREVETAFNILQNELECCGVYNRFDYKNQDQLPVSCCPAENLSRYCTNATNAFDVGCASRVYDEVTSNIGVLSYITIGLVVLQILIGVKIGIMMFRNFGTRNGYYSI